jgi:hypothetical protein
MKFTFKGVEYRVEFQYFNTPKGRKVRNSTVCRIVTGGKDDIKLITEAKVARYVTDKFVKEVARQYALKAALHVFEEISSYSVDETREFTRSANIAYYRRPGGLDQRVSDVSDDEIAVMFAR